MLVCGFELDDVILAGSFVTCAISWSALKSLKDSVCFISITAPGSGLFVVNTCWKRTCNEKTRWLGTTLFSPFGGQIWSPFLSIFQPFFKGALFLHLVCMWFAISSTLSVSWATWQTELSSHKALATVLSEKMAQVFSLVTSWNAPIFALCLISVWRTSLSMIPHSAL